MYSYYPNNPDWNDAAVILDMLSEDQIRKIESLLHARGLGVINDIKRSDRSRTSLSPLSILDTKYVPSKDLEKVALGLSTVLLHYIRKPSIGISQYQEILQNAFSLPGEMAQRLAKRIETEDILGGTYTDPSGQQLPWYKSFYLSVIEYSKRIINKIPELLSFNFRLDETQSYDLDLLYELKLLGEVVDELNSRTKLMVGQALANSTLGLFQMGDPNDVDSAYEAVGDAMRIAGTRRVPSTLFGSAKGLAILASRNQYNAAQSLKDALSKQTKGTPILASAVRSAVSAPGVGILSSLVPGGKLISALTRMGLIKTNDPTGDASDAQAIQAVADLYGDAVADAYAKGDLDETLRALNDEAISDVSTGDPDLDKSIEDAVDKAMANEFGEAIDPEQGGIFSWIRRARINAAKRRYARKFRRKMRRDARERRRRAELEALERWRQRESDLYTDDNLDLSSSLGNSTFSSPSLNDHNPESTDDDDSLSMEGE
jgi:hypothetical protein